jgi:hypothetical protein
VIHTDGLARERLCEGVPESEVDGVGDSMAVLVESDGVGVGEPKGHSVGQSVGASRVLGVGQATDGVGVVGVRLGVGVTVTVTVGDGFGLPVGLGPGMGTTVGPVFGSGADVDGAGAGAEVVARLVGELDRSESPASGAD